jgi:hypothetical protein
VALYKHRRIHFPSAREETNVDFVWIIRELPLIFRASVFSFPTAGGLASVRFWYPGPDSLEPFFYVCRVCGGF